MGTGDSGFDAPVSLRTTTEADRPDLLRLWNDGRVMHHVGFPEGLGMDDAGFDRWLRATDTDPSRHHFVVHAPGVGFCGEAFVEEVGDLGALDIKFVPEARGRGLATAALHALISRVFTERSDVEVVWTEPVITNEAARRLYDRCGLRSVPGGAPGYERRELTRSEWAGHP